MTFAAGEKGEAMKILVDEMPFWESDCPFFDGCDCKLDACCCDYMKRPAGDRCEEECRWLKAAEVCNE